MERSLMTIGIWILPMRVREERENDTSSGKSPDCPEGAHGQ
jgi:hypothetical protein